MSLCTPENSAIQKLSIIIMCVCVCLCGCEVNRSRVLFLFFVEGTVAIDLSESTLTRCAHYCYVFALEAMFAVN